jgi:hypothetical protein
MEIKECVKIYDEVMPLNILSNLIRILNKVKFEDAGIIGNNKDSGKINKNIRKTKNFNFTFMQDHSLTITHWHNLLHNIFNNFVLKFKEDLKLKELPLQKINDIIGLKYENTGFYTWHTDHHGLFPRTLSCILLLNNDYEGGNLCFRNPDGSGEWEVEVKPNRLIIWPSNFMFPHSVKPVTKGVRYSIVAWFV